MLTRAMSPDLQPVLDSARLARLKRVPLEDRTVEIPVPFPSPQDWRDQWIYFLLVDRFNNPDHLPNYAPWDGQHGIFQGGSFEGIRRQLPYLAELGVGAIWLSPVLKNCLYNSYTFHGYGIQDFLQVEPRFASDPQAAIADPQIAEDELRRLIDEAHARDIYMIFDIVLNHTGDVFEYEGFGAEAPWSDIPRPIRWRDEDGRSRPDWTDAPASPPPGGAVWPAELRNNEYFRRQGKGGEAGGDFASLKELVTTRQEVRRALIRAYQFILAKFDVDGFRIDTLKYVEPDFANLFGNAIREYALSIGKKNFFTFGEVYDDEDKIAGFIGRRASESGDLFGVDAALDFPLFFKLPGVAKAIPGFTPADIAHLYSYRKKVQREVLSTHGEASRYFVTFLENHDQWSRFYFSQPDDPNRFDAQAILGTALLFTLQGIPCLYYGAEQGLHGTGGSDAAVREALWGKPGGFNQAHPFYESIRNLSEVRASWPELRYGRQYFRPISGDGVHFGLSGFSAGVLAFSRILDSKEAVIIANTHPSNRWEGEVLVDLSLNLPGECFEVLFSNLDDPLGPGDVVMKASDQVEIYEPEGGTTRGPAHAMRVNLKPMEIQILGKT